MNNQRKYICECGAEFTEQQFYMGHCSHCETHLGKERYQKNHQLVLDKQKKAIQARSDSLLKQKETKLQKWLSEQHKCETCGKVMTEYYGSGRFCCKSCANTYSSKCVSPEESARIVEIGKKNLIHDGKNLVEYWSTHDRKEMCKGSHTGRSIDLETRKKISNTLKNRIVSEETRKKLSQSVKLSHIEGRNRGWTTRRNQESYAESFWRNILENNNIPFEQEYKVRRPNSHYYFLDFLLPGNVDLEIDGHQHKYEDRKQHDKERDEYLKSLGYIVYRIDYISPKNSEAVKEDIDKFLNWYEKVTEEVTDTDEIVTDTIF